MEIIMYGFLFTIILVNNAENIKLVHQKNVEHADLEKEKKLEDTIRKNLNSISSSNKNEEIEKKFEQYSHDINQLKDKTIKKELYELLIKKIIPHSLLSEIQDLNKRGALDMAYNFGSLGLKDMGTINKYNGVLEKIKKFNNAELREYLYTFVAQKIDALPMEIKKNVRDNMLKNDAIQEKFKNKILDIEK